MHLQIIPYYLKFKTPFHITHGIRDGTKVLFLKIAHQGTLGYGEACLPPYLSETAESVQNWISRHQKDLTTDHLFNPLANILPYDPNHPTASALLEMAAYNWYSNKHKIKPINLLAKGSPEQYQTTLTISKSDIEKLREKKLIARDFAMLKLKLTGEKDDQDFLLKVIQEIQQPFCVDLNQGWKDRKTALKNAKELKKLGCKFIEQPFFKNDYDSHLWLKERISLPIIADESIQNLDQMKKYGTCFDGVNIKLLKCGGIEYNSKLKPLGYLKPLQLHI